MDRSLIAPRHSEHAIIVKKGADSLAADTDSILDVIESWRLANSIGAIPGQQHQQGLDELSERSISAAEAVAAGLQGVSARSNVSCHTLVVVGSGKNAVGISVPLSGCKHCILP